MKKILFTMLAAIAVFVGIVVSQLSAEGHKIQIMMTVPRTVSTAFERAIMARGDHKVFHEPWKSEYIYRHRLGDAPSAEIVQAGGYNGIKELIYAYAEQSPVYVKDMIWAISDEISNDQALLSDRNVILTILVRSPPLSLESFFLKIGEKLPLDIAIVLTRSVFRYDSLVFLAKKYREIRGEWPILIEAEELCASPAVVMKDYCQRAGIRYISEALAWEQKMPEEWNHLRMWHKEAAESEGFFIPKREAKIRFSAVPEKYVPLLEAIYQEQKSNYDQLLQMKQPVSDR